MSKISAYTALTSPASGDVLPVVDISDTTMAATGTTKKITVSALLNSQAGGTTVLVAASNALPATIAAADYICDGTADDVQINAALAALGGGGRCLLSEGQFWIANPVISNNGYVTIEGTGYGTYITPQTTSTTLTAMMIIGNSGNAGWVTVSRLRLYGGQDTSTPSGHGILVYGSGITLKDLLVTSAASDGVHMDSHSGNVYENYLENVYVRFSGNDNFATTSLVNNTEFVRCYSVGGQTPAGGGSMTLAGGAFGRYGFGLAGSALKLIACHAYFCTWAVHSTSWGLQIIGGEYETNQSGGIWQGSATPYGRIIGAHIYDNLGAGIYLDFGTSGMHIRDNWIGPSGRGGLATNGIELYATSGCVVAGNIIQQVAGGGTGIYLHGASNNNTIQGNRITPLAGSPTGNGGQAVAIFDNGSGNNITGNSANGSLLELSGGSGTPSANNFQANKLTYASAVTTLIGLGSTTDSPAPGGFTPSDIGLITWNIDPLTYTAATSSVNGTIYMMQIVLRAPQTITNLGFNVSGAAVSAVASQNYIALVDSGGVIRGQTAATAIDSATQANGWLSHAMSAPYAAPAGKYYIAVLLNAATPLKFATMAIQSSSGDEGPVVTAASFRYAVNGTGATALPGSFTLSSNVHTNALVFAAGVS